MTETVPLSLKAIAIRIDSHLKRFEADPKLNGGKNRSYWQSSACVSGRKIAVTYVSYQGCGKLNREEAEAYLQWLDAGHIGAHYGVVDQVRAAATANTDGTKTMFAVIKNRYGREEIEWYKVAVKPRGTGWRVITLLDTSDDSERGNINGVRPRLSAFGFGVDINGNTVHPTLAEAVLAFKVRAESAIEAQTEELKQMQAQYETDSAALDRVMLAAQVAITESVVDELISEEKEKP